MQKARDQVVSAELRIAFPGPAETNGGRSLGAALLRPAVVPPREPLAMHGTTQPPVLDEDPSACHKRILNRTARMRTDGLTIDSAV